MSINFYSSFHSSFNNIIAERLNENIDSYLADGFWITAGVLTRILYELKMGMTYE